MASIFDWSKTAGDNDTADSAINWQENQVPSTVNNSARQMMGRVAELLDDLGAVTSTTNLSNAYSLTANSAFTALADGLIVGFKASATNTGAATLNVNALGSKAIRRIGATADIAMETGTIISGQKYLAIYDSAANAAAGAWMLLGAAPETLPNSTKFVGSGGTAGGALRLEKPASGSSLAADVSVDVLTNLFRFFEGGGTARGAYVDLTTCAAGAGSQLYHSGNREIPLTSKMLFFQAAAPTGWTQTSHNNAALRVTSGVGGGTGGSVGFTTLFARTATDAHTLTTTEMPSHYHAAGITDPGHNHDQYRAKLSGVGATGGGGASSIDSGAPYEFVSTSSDTTGIYVDGPNGVNATHSSGSGGSHSHNIDLRVIYMDVICCERTS